MQRKNKQMGLLENLFVAIVLGCGVFITSYISYLIWSVIMANI